MLAQISLKYGPGQSSEPQILLIGPPLGPAIFHGPIVFRLMDNVL